MNLDYSRTIVSKLISDAVVHFDNKRFVYGGAAKGTTVMPYRFENRFKLLEAWNRAALLARGRTE